MSEARKLHPHPGSPAVDGPPQEIPHSVPAVGDEPLVYEASHQQRTVDQGALATTATELKPIRRPQSSGVLERFAGRMAALFILSFLTFLAGVSVASAMLLGMLDIKTPWIKEIMVSIKDSINYLLQLVR